MSASLAESSEKQLFGIVALSRYTHRVAISNQRLIALDEHGVTFRWKDYRAKGKTRIKTMTLSANEFMRRFLLHVLPRGFHRIRHYGLIANGERKDNLAKARELLHAVPDADAQSQATDASVPAVEPTFACPHCGASVSIIDIFLRGQLIRAPPRHRAAARAHAALDVQTAPRVLREQSRSSAALSYAATMSRPRRCSPRFPPLGLVRRLPGDLG